MAEAPRAARELALEEGFVTVLGGAKVDEKIGVVKALLPRVSKLLVGGAMAWGFFKAKGMEVGKSLCTPESAAAASTPMKLSIKRIPRILIFLTIAPVAAS